MKMSDVFDLPVKPSQLEVYGANSNEGISFDEIESAAAHAINNHDHLTEENAKLREALEQSSEVLRRQLSQYYYKDEVAMLNQYESNKQLLNQLKEQNNDSMA